MPARVCTQLPARRPNELSRLSKKNKTVHRAYGGHLSHAVVKERIIRAFLVEEQKIVKKVRGARGRAGGRAGVGGDGRAGGRGSGAQHVERGAVPARAPYLSCASRCRVGRCRLGGGAGAECRCSSCRRPRRRPAPRSERPSAAAVHVTFHIERREKRPFRQQRSKGKPGKMRRKGWQEAVGRKRGSRNATGHALPSAPAEKEPIAQPRSSSSGGK